MNTIHDFGTKKSKKKQKEQHFQTAKGLETVLKHLHRFLSTPNLTFDQLTPELLLKFKNYLIERSCCRNTCTNYLVRLRGMHRQAAAEERATPPGDLYRCVLTDKTEASAQRSISARELIQVWSANLNNSPTRVRQARDILILSFCLRGIPFVDLAKLRKTDIKQGILHYCRSKTGKALTIRIPPYAMEIIERWKNRETASPLLFPFIKRPGEADEHKQYNSAQRLYNKHLCELANELGMGDLKLSSYTSRHTWATLAHEAGIDITYISEALSHSDVRTTQHYLAASTVDKLNDINERVIATVRPKPRKKDNEEPERTNR